MVQLFKKQHSNKGQTRAVQIKQEMKKSQLISVG